MRRSQGRFLQQPASDTWYSKAYCTIAITIADIFCPDKNPEHIITMSANPDSVVNQGQFHSSVPPAKQSTGGVSPSP